MTYYFYDPVTFEYIGQMAASGRQGANPPDDCTTDVPNPPEGHAAFRDLECFEWRYIEDHRGKLAYAKDLSGVLTIETVGTVPEDFTLEPPPPQKQGFVVEFKRKYWGYTEDHRGEVGYVNGEQVTITELGELPEGWTTEAPPPPPVQPEPDTRTPEEKRRAAYRSELDPIAREVSGYLTEAEAYLDVGDDASAAECDAKAKALRAVYLEKKREIRSRFPDDGVEVIPESTKKATRKAK